MLADRVWDLRKHDHISLEDLVTIPKLKITPELLDCLEINSVDHSDHEDAEQLPSDGMDDYLAEYMGSSLLDDSYDDLNVKIPKSVPKEIHVGHKLLATNYPHTAQPLSEPRRHRILPSKHNGTNNQINHEYKYKPDHT